MTAIELPGGLTLRRTTDTWDQDTVPAGLLRAHRIAEGVWGRLVVISGRLDLVFEDDDTTVGLGAGEASAIPPGRPHHVVIAGEAAFHVEFHR